MVAYIHEIKVTRFFFPFFIMEENLKYCPFLQNSIKNVFGLFQIDLEREVKTFESMSLARSCDDRNYLSPDYNWSHIFISLSFIIKPSKDLFPTNR